MPAGRDQVDFTDVRYDGLTFKYDGSIVYNAALAGRSAQVGLAVKLTGNGTVGLTTTGSDVLGTLIDVDSDGFCTVQDRGCATMKKGDGAVVRGTPVVGDVRTAAGGYVRSAVSATAAELLVAKGRILDIADAEAIMVDLDG